LQQTLSVNDIYLQNTKLLFTQPNSYFCYSSTKFELNNLKQLDVCSCCLKSPKMFALKTR